ncbi:unnamed protein product, partial [Gongylonema pulchrum]|uniref:T-complex protein 1 subunit zeta 1 n=1 Tax=Gongylonema pulchrum TaxID=637853 RepID=A0A183EK90_9BILA
LGSADLVEEISVGGGEKIIQVTGVQNPGQAVSILIRGSNKLVLEEAERSIHDALCVIRCLVKKRALVSGGGAPEMEVAVQLRQLALERHGAEQYCWRAFADALEQVPYTLAENAGLNPIATVTEMRSQHANGKKNHGINVRRVRFSYYIKNKSLRLHPEAAHIFQICAGFSRDFRYNKPFRYESPNFIVN